MKKQLLIAGVSVLASLGAACASQPSAEQKQELIAHYQSSPITAADAQSVREHIAQEARSVCRPYGPRRENDILQRRHCTQDFIADVVSGIGNPILLSAAKAEADDHGILNDGACANSGRNGFTPGPRKSHGANRSCARASH